MVCYICGVTGKKIKSLNIALLDKTKLLRHLCSNVPSQYVIVSLNGKYCDVVTQLILFFCGILSRAPTLWHFRFSWRRVWTWLSSGMLRRVLSQNLTEVSVVLTASIIRTLNALMMEAAPLKRRSNSARLHGATSQTTFTLNPNTVLVWITTRVSYWVKKMYRCTKRLWDVEVFNAADCGPLGCGTNRSQSQHFKSYYNWEFSVCC
jgi:hypothetical protein